MSDRVRVYEVYGRWGRWFSRRPESGIETTVHVAARSIRQAYALATKGVVATDPENPVGILEQRDAGPWHHHDGSVSPAAVFSPGWGKRRIAAAMAAHAEPPAGIGSE